MEIVVMYVSIDGDCAEDFEAVVEPNVGYNHRPGWHICGGHVCKNCGDCAEDFEAVVEPNVGYKLFRLHKDGSIGPLFINKRQRLEIGEAYEAEDHSIKGYAHRPGWHICGDPIAPHLSKKNRIWAKVEFEDYEELKRPASQGSKWYLARMMRVVELLPEVV